MQVHPSKGNELPKNTLLECEKLTKYPKNTEKITDRIVMSGI